MGGVSMEREPEPRKTIRVAFLVPSLEVGGAERVVTNIVRNIDRREFTPVLVLFSKRGGLLAEVPEDVGIYSMRELKGSYWYGFQWVSLLRQLCRYVRTIEPDVLVSFTWYANAVSLVSKILRKLRCRVVVSERTSTYAYEGTWANYLRTLVLRFLYPRADLVIAPSRGIAADLGLLRTIATDKIRVIHNPVERAVIEELSKQSPSDTWFDMRRNVIVSAGRLGSEKGFDFLIRSVAILVNDGVECALVILGEGTERQRLEALSRELGVAEHVAMPGFQKNPYKYLANATLFVLPSLYEGFPNVLLEAMSLGVPAVATRCPTGPEEIIEDGIDGILVPPADEKALAKAIKRLLFDADLRKRLGEAGEKRARAFRVEAIVGQYEDGIRSLLRGSA